ncbi:MAG: hypothetical protein PHQ43_12230 [Dehalococcoidales bacterium]|nr:hypothetical protein [Dehalococcoidales bacterium]
MRYQIIDKATGQITDTNSLFPEPMTDEGYLFPARKLGARSFRYAAWPPEITYSDRGMIDDLATSHMIAGANLLGYRANNRIVPYTAKEIADLVGLRSRSKRSRWINKMLSLRVMHRIQEHSGKWQYYINPAYKLAPGYRLSLNLYLLFRDYLDPLLPERIRNEFLSRAPERGMISTDATAEVERMMKGGK